MKCKICKQNTERLFEARILNKYDIKYFYCINCGFLQTEKPYWLNEAYKESINIYDTGIVSRNIILSKKASLLLNFCFHKADSFLDYAGGYGLFTRMMRDIGFDFYWNDPFSQNLTARGFEYKKNTDNAISAITSFESFEHFEDPLGEIKKMLEIAPNIIFTTELLPSIIPKPQDWWYYGLEHGQHISFYSEKTLRLIAHKFGLNYYTDHKSFHFFSKKQLNYLVKKLLFSSFFTKIFFSLIKKKYKSKTYTDMEKLIHKRSVSYPNE